MNTASDGTFAFQDIPQGPFSLHSSNTPGYQDAQYNPEGKPGQFTEFTLADREQRSDIVIKVKEACRISGRILDENGKIPEDVDRMYGLGLVPKRRRPEI